MCRAMVLVNIVHQSMMMQFVVFVWMERPPTPMSFSFVTYAIWLSIRQVIYYKFNKCSLSEIFPFGLIQA